ncbi:MAG: hypothetical protein M3P49_03285 [Actinomycetota bacterium]|nr:hypothetical protein [Actinomycetota bacterium]
MHRLARGYDARLRRLEAAIPPFPPTPEEIECVESRRLELCRAGLNAVEPEDLSEGERELFEKIQKSASIFLELVHEGLVSWSGGPGGGDDLSHDVVDGDDDGVPVWRP